MKKIKKQLFSVMIIIITLLSITISFAWMLEISIPFARRIGFDYGNNDTNLAIASNTIDAKLEVRNNDRFEEISSTSSTTPQDVFVRNDFKPNDIIKYKITIKNKSNIDNTINILFQDIQLPTDENAKNEFLQYIHIGIISSSGFHYPYEAPKVNDFTLGEMLTTAGNNNYASFIKDLVLPANNTGDPNYQGVEINFYIKLDYRATNAVQNQNLSIGKISFIVA